MAVSGAHFTLRPGALNALVVHWVYDPRRVTDARQGLQAGPSIEDASTVSIDVTTTLDGDFPAGFPLPLVDFFATVEWSSGGKEVQRVEFDCLNGGSVSMAAARAAVYCTYAVDPTIDAVSLAAMPNAEVNVTIGRMPTGKQRPRRTRQLGTIPIAGASTVSIPNFSDGVVILSDQIPLVARVEQYQGNFLSSAQNVASSLTPAPIDSLANLVTVVNNGGIAARMAAQFTLAL